MSVGVDAWLTIASLHKLQVVILQWFISVIVNKNLGAPTPRWRWLKVSLTLVFLFLVSCSKKCFVAFSFPSVFSLSLADWWTLSSNNNSVETEICDLTPNHSKKCFLKALFFLPPGPVASESKTFYLWHSNWMSHIWYSESKSGSSWLPVVAGGGVSRTRLATVRQFFAKQ